MRLHDLVLSDACWLHHLILGMLVLHSTHGLPRVLLSLSPCSVVALGEGDTQGTLAIEVASESIYEPVSRSLSCLFLGVFILTNSLLSHLLALESDNTGSVGASIRKILNFSMFNLSNGFEQLRQIAVLGDPWQLFLMSVVPPNQIRRCRTYVADVDIRVLIAATSDSIGEFIAGCGRSSLEVGAPAVAWGTSRTTIEATTESTSKSTAAAKSTTATEATTKATTRAAETTASRETTTATAAKAPAGNTSETVRANFENAVVPVTSIEHGDGILSIGFIVEVYDTRSLKAAVIVVQIDV